MVRHNFKERKPSYRNPTVLVSRRALWGFTIQQKVNYPIPGSGSKDSLTPTMKTCQETPPDTSPSFSNSALPTSSAFSATPLCGPESNTKILWVDRSDTRVNSITNTRPELTHGSSRNVGDVDLPAEETFSRSSFAGLFFSYSTPQSKNFHLLVIYICSNVSFQDWRTYKKA